MKKKLDAFLLLLVVVGTCVAQNDPSMFVVYESQVKPSMNTTYQEAVKKLAATCQQQKMTFTWYAGTVDDNSYIYLVPIKNFADLDKNVFDPLITKIGKEAFMSLWQSIDKCVEEQTSSVAQFLPGNSYLSPATGENFRNVFYWIPEIGKEAEAEKLSEEWYKLFTSKNSPVGFHVYRNIFGADRGYVVVGWGKNEADYAAKIQKRNELLGDELGKLWAKTLLITKKYYTRVGWTLPELCYPPSPN